MGIRKLNPVTPGTRHKVITDFEGITTRVPEKSLTTGTNKSGGRNHSGKMTMRYIGGGHKQSYREIDLKRDKYGIPAVVKTIEYDPNRTARIALLFYADGEKRYMLAPNGLKVGQEVLSGRSGVAPEVGNTLPLSEIPLGTVVHNIELQPGKGGSIARSAGTFAQLSAREGKYATLKMPSGELRMILVACLATIGTVGNSEHMLQKSGKAGRSRWQGRRPRTRPVAMNPVDHPMGGGEGRASGGHPRSRKGLLAKGKKTRAPKNRSNRFILERINAKKGA
ncbi:MAG: 50S ribosomal protein L2 [Flavobacteriales bacterium]|jgi:large subunit ribosomal protein L2|nr:50S ribosomal protein L2 [Flavobacteriales bacterium]MBK6883012.1 50S ribosomal protein L2 [Flavobacteriales bacterium]MBK7101998.1 50S ribosomal protein L2 [Flavobacteriales bacterium]MBK7114349.1 50S ribosomal protein L2 [Flavobacteriales bacterium]MBK7483590.1 50S ribosomal protein L2 [Flavobacteriales bacterium]